MRSAPNDPSTRGGGTNREALACVVLCGGASRRMGEDKALVEIGGRALIDRALDAVRPLGSPVWLATGPRDRYADRCDLRVQDAAGTAGPAAGLLAALEATTADRVLAVACDMPRLDARVLDALARRARDRDLDACFLTSERGREPLCAVYSRRVIPALRAAQAAGRYAVVAFLDGPEGAAFTAGELRAEEVPGADDCARNLNTPEDLYDERGALGTEDES